MTPTRCLALVLCSASLSARAADPDVIIVNQGRLIGAEEKPVVGPLDVTLGIYPTKDAEDPVWTETYNVVFGKDGLYSVALGDTTGRKKPLAAADVAGPRWLGMTVNNLELLPRLRIGDVPMALRARFSDESDKLGGHVAADYALKTEVSSDATKLQGHPASDFLLVGAKAADSAKLDGHSLTDFVLSSGGRAPDADKLEGHPASDFVLATGGSAPNALKFDNRPVSDFVLAGTNGAAPNALKFDGRPVSDFVLAGAGGAAPNALKLENKSAADFALVNHTHDDKYMAITGPVVLPSTRPTSPAAGTVAYSGTSKTPEFFDGSAWQPISRRSKATSCRDLLNQGVAADGIYKITPKVGGPEVDAYCDMTTDGGGWTLVSYGYRTSTGTTAYNMPNAFTSTWNPTTRDSAGAIDASDLIRNSTAAGLTTTTGGAAVTGNLRAYATAHVWPIQNPAAVAMILDDQSSCQDIWVRDIKNNTYFSAKQQLNRLTVSCSGNKAGTPYERMFLGFNSGGCYGVCGTDPAQSMGMNVWYGSGYCPSTSGGQGCPERAGSFAFWLK